MPKLSDAQRKFLEESTVRYRKSLPGSPAAEHLESRGLTGKLVDTFCLGYVDDPLPGHDRFAGTLAIPYLRKGPSGDWTVVSIRFRCIRPECDHTDHPGAKYITVAGDTPRLYNTLALHESDDFVAITEGELDAITATMCGIPAVGVAGASSWKDHFTNPFLGYESVFILADGDDAGDRFASSVAKVVPNAKIISFAAGEDVNSEYLKNGADSIRERLGL